MLGNYRAASRVVLSSTELVEFIVNSRQFRDAVAEQRGQSGNPEEGECLQLESVTRGLVKRADLED
jgi:hypothetical protein